MSRQLLFSLTKKDFKAQYFCAGGKGGQHQNKVATACRIKHPDSGAVAFCKKHRTQLLNKREAFTKLLQTKEFKLWHKMYTARIMGKMKTPEQIMEEVEESMKPENLKIETF